MWKRDNFDHDNFFCTIHSFTQRKRLSELIDYITVMPDSTSSKNRGHKYPFLAHHIFTEGGDGVNEIIDKFFFSYSDEDIIVNNQNTEL